MSLLLGAHQGANGSGRRALPSIALVQCHPMKQPHVERREDEFAQLLTGLGHRIAVFAISESLGDPGSALQHQTNFFLPEDTTLQRPLWGSKALVDAVAAFSPDIVLFKGLGYRILDMVADRLGGKSRLGVILGGSARSAALSSMDFVFVEYSRQIESIRGKYGCMDTTFFEMPKLIPWSLVPVAPSDPPRWDACCVSAFIERKNHKVLKDLFGRCRLALVGEGPERPAIEAMAASLEPESRPVFTGSLSREAVMKTMAASRLLVHPSTWEGMPRVSIEGFACGLPLVALKSTLTPAFGGLPFVRLCDESDFCATVMDCLADSDWLAEMSIEARRHAVERYGPSALKRIAEQFSSASALGVASRPTSSAGARFAEPAQALDPEVQDTPTIVDDMLAPAAPQAGVVGASGGSTTAAEVEYEGFRMSLEHPSITSEIADSLRKGTYERAEARLLRLGLRPGDRVLELGSGMGLTSMICARVVGPENVLTFEPNPVMREIALRNFSLNGLAIRCRQQIVQPHKRFTGRAEFFLHPSIMSSSLKRLKRGQRIELEAVPAEAIIEEEKSNVLVLDVEGYEAEFLSKTDLTGIDLIICECHYRKVGRAAINRMIKRLYRRGFFLDLAASANEVVMLHRGADGRT